MEDLNQGGQPEAVQTPAQDAQPQTPPPAEPPKAPAQPLAEVIRAAREARETAAKKDSEAADLKRQLAERDAEIARYKSADDPFSDPMKALAAIKARKLAPELQAEIGQAFLYDLVPDKAPQDFRVKLLEGRIARETAAKEEAARRAAQEAQEIEARKLLESYDLTVRAAARSFNPGSHPESEAWFGDDAETYSRSLLATARNLAEVAKTTGVQADLSPGHVADVLEKEIALRLKARDARRAGASKSANTAQPQERAAGDGGQTVSTKGLSSGGPRPPALDDKERVARAIAAAFPNR